MKEKMMNSKFGKLLRRIVGEETGAVMMEYVIVAVLVAAAAVIAIAIFGKSIVGQTNAATKATMGQGNDAASLVEKNRTTMKTGIEGEAITTADKFSDASTKAVGKGGN